MRHLVPENERYFVPISVAQVDEPPRDEDETAGQGEGGWPIRLDACHLEAMKSIANRNPKLRPYLFE